MIIRLLAAAWLVTTLWSLAMGVRLLASASRNDVATRLASFTTGVEPIKKWQSRLAMLLVIALVRGFFTASLNTSLWPWSTVAWVALFTQLLFLRPLLLGYVDIVQRGFTRPVERYIIGHVVLDLLVATPLVAIVVNGLR